jgi:hypothetical protein
MSSSPDRLPIAPEMGSAYGIELRKMGRVSLQRAYSPKAWLAMRYGLRVQKTYRSFAYSALVSFTPGGKLPTPDKFYKGGSQEKTHLPRPEFFLLPSPPDRARSVLNFRAMDSGAGHGGPAVWVFSTSGFHRLFATKPVSSETSKAERWSGANHGSIGDSWPIAFSGYPRGPRVGWETKCPRHILPNFTAETRSRTRVSPEPNGHRQRNSRDGRTRSETLKLFVVSDVGRRS